ncbi:MAG: right-handed parallel beta-helix repeat-containing protein, partial [Euryarchaeota archaeon]|nr:right-handed parallel beta-helix repeat-containing protein [Euryarchaeota archaeon]
MVIVHNTRYTGYKRSLRSLLTVFLMLFIALCIAQVQAQPITPPAVITAPGTYELTGDATGIYEGYGIKIEASDVILDGQGFNLRGSSRNDVGILVNKYGTALRNVEIKNIKLGNWETAIRYNYVKSDETDISGISNTQINSAKVGVHVEYSDNVLLSELSLTDTNSAIVVNHESSDVTIDKATITDCGIGVTLEHARGVTISNSNVNTCEVYGIQAGDVQDLTISKTNISDNKYAAITLADVNGFTLHSNVIART